MLLNQARKSCSGRFKPNVIIGITRRGWIPARVMSGILGIYYLATIEVEFYLGVADTRNTPFLTRDIPINDGKKMLVVDDIIDTGKSLQLIVNYLKQQDVSELRTATLYRKP